MKLVGTFLFVVFLTGCAAIETKSSVSGYNEVAHKINLGDSREYVLSLLLPIQPDTSVIGVESGKASETFMNGDVLVEIYYIRSGWIMDGKPTDDEFTPYIFNNGKLVSIGWAILGGPKTHGQATSSDSNSGGGMSNMCKNAIANGDSGGVRTFCD
jgi:hypothetical protein